MLSIYYPDIFFSLACLFSYYVHYVLKNWNSSLPTNWPLLGTTPSLLWNFHRFHDYIASILKKNGDTFLLKGPLYTNMDMLFTSDPANIHHISCTNFKNYPKGPEFREMYDVLGDGIFTVDHKLWEMHRKITMSLLKPVGFWNILENTTWHMVETRLIPVLESLTKKGSTADLQDIFQRFTFDSFVNVVSNYDPQTLSVDFPDNEFKTAFTKTEEAIFFRHALPKFCWKLLKLFQIGNEKHITHALKLSDEILYEQINKVREAQKKNKEVEEIEDDFKLLTGLMKEFKGQIGGFGDEDKIVKDALLTLVVAGRDTTSTALAWLFYLLSKNPLIERKILEEIHTQLGLKDGKKWKSFGAKELEKLVYLEGALYETLRLFPSVPVNYRVALEEDTLPSGHKVHKNSIIMMSFYAMGKMDSIWGKDCLEFKPQRWFSERGGIKHVPSYKFPAFHSGPRSCLGKRLSFTTMKVVASTIIYNYKVEVLEGQKITQDASVVLQMKHGMKVKIIKRNEGRPH